MQATLRCKGMNVVKLVPPPAERTQFAWSHRAQVPAKPGCYALVTYNGDVLYVGLATGSVQSRMASHLDTSEKRKGSPLGVPFWFYYSIVTEPYKVGPIERGWMNQAILEDGEIPFLNKVFSPI